MKINMVRIPCINLEEAEKFYTERVGLNKVFGSASDGFIGCQLENIQVLLEIEENGEFECGSFLGFSLEVEDIDEYYEASKQKGMNFTAPPKNSFGVV